MVRGEKGGSKKWESVARIAFASGLGIWLLALSLGQVAVSDRLDDLFIPEAQNPYEYAAHLGICGNWAPPEDVIAQVEADCGTWVEQGVFETLEECIASSTPAALISSNCTYQAHTDGADYAECLRDDTLGAVARRRDRCGELLMDPSWKGISFLECTDLSSQLDPMRAECRRWKEVAYRQTTSRTLWWE